MHAKTIPDAQAVPYCPLYIFGTLTRSNGSPSLIFHPIGKSKNATESWQFFLAFWYNKFCVTPPQYDVIRRQRVRTSVLFYNVDALLQLQCPYYMANRKTEKCARIVTFFPFFSAQMILCHDVSKWRPTTLSPTDVSIFLQRWRTLTAPAPLLLDRSENRKVRLNRHIFSLILS